MEFILTEQGFDALSIPEPQYLAEIISFARNVILLNDILKDKLKSAQVDKAMRGWNRSDNAAV